MEIKPHIDHERKFIRLEISGDLNFDFSQSIGKEGRHLAQDMGYPIIYDIRFAKLQMSVSELFYLPRHLDELNLPRSEKVAFLVSKKIPKDTLEFYENVTNNIGIPSKVFFDVAEAENWISSSSDE